MAVIAVDATVAVAVASKMKLSRDRGHLFRPHAALFTPAERSFLGVLDQAYAGRYRVFGKVRIADMISPARGLDKSARASASNRITDTRIFRNPSGWFDLYLSTNYRGVRCSICVTMHDDA